MFPYKQVLVYANNSKQKITCKIYFSFIAIIGLFCSFIMVEKKQMQK